MAPSLGLRALAVFSNLFAGFVSVMRTITCSRKNKKADDYTWRKPSPEDRRSPCPMLNALANHGYLPRDGKDVSLTRLVVAMQESINLSPDATLFAGIIALKASTTGNKYSFHLDDLAKHGVIEHDGSLSRHDVHSPPPLNNSSFAPELWATVVPHFADSETISIETANKARRARIAAAKEMDPQFAMSEQDRRASVIESCLYLRVFGEGVEGRARREWVRVLFEQERLPFDEGFKRSDKVLTITDIRILEDKINALPEEGGK